MGEWSEYFEDFPDENPANDRDPYSVKQNTEHGVFFDTSFTRAEQLAKAQRMAEHRASIQKSQAAFKYPKNGI